MKIYQVIFVLFVSILLSNAMLAQGTIRGFVYDKDSGEPILFGSVFLSGTTMGATTDLNGFFNIANVPAGKYDVVCQYVGYDSTGVTIDVADGRIINQSLYLIESSTKLDVVNVTAAKEEAKSDVRVSVTKVTAKQIKSIPGMGGEADLAQYLQVLPGVIFTGDQGGQLYIRGGSPIQNKILLDGMTVYNPFHSIGFFSVFETEIIRNVDVYTGGFSAEYGGRTSAIIDITSKDGNKKRFGGNLGVNPFQAKLLLEGPIIKLDEDKGTSMSFILSGKHSYLAETSKVLYQYIDKAGLPYGFTDLYGKVSLNGKTGSKLNLFGFNYRDNVDFEGLADLNWNSYGVGSNFKLVPNNSPVIIGGHFAYSDYNITLEEEENKPRNSKMTGFDVGLDFTSYFEKGDFKYGLEVGGFTTDFRFTNAFNSIIEQKEFNTELAAFMKLKYQFGPMIVEPSLRGHYYASISEFSLEPRIGMKVNITDYLRFKLAGGLFSQNLISAVNEQDVVNLFVGFLSSPSNLDKPNSTENADHRLQKSVHAIGGFEIDLFKNAELNIEPYYKLFPQLINLNRNKLTSSDSDFATETGKAYGIDFLAKYDTKRTFVWLAYSYGHVKRDDGIQEYPTHFDRRHNVNALTTYKMGKAGDWEASVRWNLGSGFPFTLTQGFFEYLPFEEGIETDYISNNGTLGVIYSDDRNSGRLPYYHRFDVSLKKSFEFSKYYKMQVYASVTNVYNRENIFYFDRIQYNRVNQLPILPSLGVNLEF